MGETRIYHCDFCKYESRIAKDVLYERIAVTGQKSIKWEDICLDCWKSLQEYISELRK